jgi:hypothetical protein
MLVQRDSRWRRVLRDARPFTTPGFWAVAAVVALVAAIIEQMYFSGLPWIPGTLPIIAVVLLAGGVLLNKLR